MGRWIAGLVFAGAALGGCSDGPVAPMFPDVRGTWEGSFQASPTAPPVDVRVTLFDVDGVISGAGVFSAAFVTSVAFDLSGSYQYPVLAFSLKATGTQDANFSGEVWPSGDVIQGRLNGSGFTDVLLTLRRP